KYAGNVKVVYFLHIKKYLEFHPLLVEMLYMSSLSLAMSSFKHLLPHGNSSPHYQQHLARPILMAVLKLASEALCVTTIISANPCFAGVCKMRSKLMPS